MTVLRRIADAITERLVPHAEAAAAGQICKQMGTCPGGGANYCCRPTSGGMWACIC
ncbi:hypothetical protein Afil01_43890 [Actinorhabdospora filicis]|uniref:Uncharacterized protein n=1 Tax=Actinorhabdospora filicis TaxID=1785913 RepID=A0A9W6W4S3_9ACTN|nr:hypothetical protein [Actinorhabdospora filicis]GLZ79582.1 hypothetical protein Afil01_43890 [Actinorhabdospora filicis]